MRPTWFVFTIAACSVAGATGCTIDPMALSGKQCGAEGQCAQGYDCHPFTATCAPTVTVGCDGVGLCPEQVGPGTSCEHAGSFVPCFSTYSDCTAGCRTCLADGTWSDCQCELGVLQNCASCGNDCDVSVLGAEPVCDTSGEQPSCDYSGDCHAGYHDIDGDRTNGCEYRCSPTQPDLEECDQVDNDCDGLTDNIPDASINHVCALEWPGARQVSGWACTAGQCTIDECVLYYWDFDLLPDNGCEAFCSLPSDEVCDGQDNNCDGLTDNMTQPQVSDSCEAVHPLATDVNQWQCSSGGCAIGQCVAGMMDINHDPSDGCEAGCVPSEPPIEQCDGYDNNCDGDSDNVSPADLLDQCTDENPGASGVADWTCRNSTCAAELCRIYYWDLNGVPADGCEYFCVSAGDTELCNNADDNCDGQTDEGLGLGQLCGVGECDGGELECDGGGGTRCSSMPGGSDPQAGPEDCDGLDNDCDDATPDGSGVAPYGNSCDGPDTDLCTDGQMACNGSSYYCDDASDEHPDGPVGAPACDDGVDNDCDGAIDEPVSYANRRQITIHHTAVAGNLTNFPILIDIPGDAYTDLFSVANSGLVASSGWDIVFHMPGMACNQTLDHERVLYAASNGRYMAWVRIPSLSGSQDTVLHMYYGKAGVSSSENPHGVWDSSYVGVWHLDNINVTDEATTASAYTNSKADAHHGTSYNCYDETGKIRRAADFDGTGDYVSFPALNPTSISPSTDTMTISAWLRVDGNQPDYTGMVFCRGGNTVAGLNMISNDHMGYHWNDAANTHGWTGGPTAPINNTWVYVALVVTPSAGLIYTNNNAAIQNGAVTHAAPEQFDFAMELGRDNTDPGNRSFTGRIDEVRISTVARSAQWIETSYNNQNVRPGSFYTIGPREQLR